MPPSVKEPRGAVRASETRGKLCQAQGWKRASKSVSVEAQYANAEQNVAKGRDAQTVGEFVRGSKEHSAFSQEFVTVARNLGSTKSAKKAHNSRSGGWYGTVDSNVPSLP